MSDLHARLNTHTFPFLACLTGSTIESAWDTEAHWQTFTDPHPKPNPDPLAEHWHQSIDEAAAKLDDLNERSAGAFVTVNPTDGKGRQKANIPAIRGWWADLDTKAASVLFTLDRLPLAPTMAVKTPGGWHLYWLAHEPMASETEARRDEHESDLLGIQQVLECFGADRKTCNVNCVLRLPGFFHRKEEPRLVELAFADGPRYSCEQIRAAFPPVPRSSKKVPKTAPPKSPNPKREEVLKRAGAYLGTMPGGVQGEEGSGATFQAALKVITKFNLTEAEALDLMERIHNPKCEPEWSPGELRHKVADAWKQAQSAPNLGEFEKPEPQGERPSILVREEHQVTREALAALVPHREVFQRGGVLVRVVRSSDGKNFPTLHPATSPWLRETLSRRVDFRKATQDGSRKTLTPDWLPTMLLDRKYWPEIPELRALVEVPVFLPDGRALTTPGMDDESGLNFTPLRTTWPPIPECPTRADAEAARDQLWEVVADFPWASRPSQAAHRATWLAFLLTIVGRFAIEGPVPFALIEASSQASGKGLLTSITSLIALGRVVPAGQVSIDEEELRKSLLSTLRQGDRLAWLEEVPDPFGGRVWNGLITAYPDYSDRILGKSERACVPALTCWVATGNNIHLKGDSSRRALHIRLEPQDENPEQRGGWRHDNLTDWVGQNRPRLLNAALTILCAFHMAGRPSSGLPSVGSFEAWGALIRDAVFWITGEDATQTQRELGVVVDESRAAWKTLLAGLYALFGEKLFSAKEALGELTKSHNGPEIEAAHQAAELLKHGPELNARGMGKSILGKHIGQVAGGLKLHSEIATNLGNLYRVERIFPQPKETTPRNPEEENRPQGLKGFQGLFPQSEGRNVVEEEPPSLLPPAVGDDWADI